MVLPSKIGEDPLTLPMRQRMYDAIAMNPGIAFVRLRNLLASSTGATQYHAWILARYGLIRDVRTGRFRRYYPIGALPAEAIHGHALLLNAPCRRAYEAAQRSPGVKQGNLAREGGFSSQQALHYHLVRLINAKLIRTERDEKFLRHWAEAPPQRLFGGPPGRPRLDRFVEETVTEEQDGPSAYSAVEA